jgi:hypothetical protein
MYKHHHFFLLVLLIPILLVNCGRLGGDIPLAFTTVSQSGSLDPDGRDAPALYIIANAQEIDSVAQSAMGLQSPLPGNLQMIIDQLHRQDYQRVLVVIALQGARTGGSGMKVQQVVKDGDKISIYADLHKPGPLEARPAIVADPYHIIAVTKEGDWGKVMDFQLVSNDEVVASATHFIP